MEWINVNYILTNIRGLGPRHEKTWPLLEIGRLILSEGCRNKADHGKLGAMGQKVMENSWCSQLTQ